MDALRCPPGDAAVAKLSGGEKRRVGLTKLLLSKPDILLLAPGPINRGVEITPEVADGPHSAILEQVTNGLAVRMAVLHLLCGHDKD